MGAVGVSSLWLSHRVIQHHGNFPNLNDSFWNRNVKLPSVYSFARPKLLPFYKHSKNIDCLPHNQVSVCFNLWYFKLKEYWSQRPKIWLWQILAVWTWATHLNSLGLATPSTCGKGARHKMKGHMARWWRAQAQQWSQVTLLTLPLTRVWLCTMFHWSTVDIHYYDTCRCTTVIHRFHTL